MGITIELYRIRIGHFKSNKPRKMKLIELPRGKQSKVTILIFSFIIFQLCNGCFQTRSDFCRTTNAVNVKASNIDNSRVETACAFSWAQSGLLINKIQKIINGNRRSVGYRLAVWNCGRGLIQEGFSVKLNEVKHFLRSKKPHCLGVIESDLFSHKCQTSRAKYTTAELKEILNIDGYN